MKKVLHNSIWIIIKSCLILSSIAFSLMILSCSTPNSVRSGKQFILTNSNTEKKKNDVDKNEANLQIQEAEKLYEKMNNYTIKQNENIGKFTNDQEIMTNAQRKIPSLREQMKIYTEQQDKMLDKLTFLERDIDNIKNDIEDIKVTIRALLANQNEKSANGIYGDNKNKSQDNMIRNNQSGFYLYPDEENEISSYTDSEKKSKNKKVEQTKYHNKEITKNNYSIQTEKPTEKNKNIKKIDKEKQTQQKTNSTEFELAMDYLKNRDYQSALEELTKLENKQNDISEKQRTYYWLGESYFGLGNYNKAIEYFRKVLKSGNNYKKDYATIMIAESYLRIGRVEEAKKSYARFVDEYPNSNQLPRAKKMLQQL